MSAGRNTVTLYFAAVGGVLLIGLILFAPWPLWAMLVMVVALAATLALLVKAISGRPLRPTRSAREEPLWSHSSTPSMEARRTRVSEVPLPTDLDDYSFVFSATVLWSPTTTVMEESSINMPALAVDAVLSRAREITARRDPGHAALVRHELAGRLAEMRADTTGHLRAMAESVQLVLPDQDQERLSKLAAVRKDEAVWEHERRYEQSKRAYLGEDVLKDTGSAVVWYLARNEDQVERTVQDIGLLAQLSSAANNTDVPETFQPFVSELGPDPDGSPRDHAGVASEREESVADRCDAFLQAMRFDESDPQCRLFARRVADLATVHGKTDIADELIRRFDAAGDGEGEAGDES